MASISVGAVFGRYILGEDDEIRPCDWLVWNEGEPTWESSLKWRPGAPRGVAMPTRQVFLAYCHDNKSQVATLHTALQKANVNICWDERICGGQCLNYVTFQAIEQSCAVVVCFSYELIKKRVRSYVYPEIYHAI